MESNLNREKGFCQSHEYPIDGNTTSTSRVVQLLPEAVDRLIAPRTRPTGGLGPSTAHGANLLDAVRSLDEWAADLLGCQDASLDKFRFRVVIQDSCQCPPGKPRLNDARPISSYIAVSYCWHYNAWQPALGIQCDASGFTSNISNQKMPLMPAMYAAVLDERSSDMEPVWLDRWCINQEDEDEKIIAIGMMDLVYTSARKVIACLEDVRLSAKDREILLDFGRCLEESSLSSLDDVRGITERDWNDKKGHLFEAITKIFAARWFTRAWCTHEFWLGQESIFLVPVTIDPTSRVPEDGIATILRFNSVFLAAAHALTAMWIPGDQADSMHKKERHWQEYVQHSHPYYWDGIFDFRDGQYCSKVAFTHAMTFSNGFKSAMKPLPCQEGFALINTLGSTNTADKLAITLNLGRTGLYFKGGQHLSAGEIAWIVTIIALASGDATVLAATGPHIQSLLGTGGRVGDKSEATIGWANVPELDRYVRLDRDDSDGSFSRTKMPVVISEKGLELDMIDLGTTSQIKAPDGLKTCLAEAAIDWLSDQGLQLHDPSIFVGSSLRRRHLIQALACLLTGGANWSIACAAQVRPHPLDPQRYVRLAQSETEIEGAFLALDRVAFSTEGMDTAMPRLTDMFDLEGTKELLDIKQRDNDIIPSVKALVTVADALVRTLIGEQIEYDHEMISKTNELHVCVTNVAAHGGIVIFTPPLPPATDESGHYELMCPDVLRKKDKFNKCPRKGWVLQRVEPLAATAAASGHHHSVQHEDVTEEEADQTRRYRLLDKTVLFMPLVDPITDSDPLSIYRPRKIIVG